MRADENLTAVGVLDPEYVNQLPAAHALLFQSIEPTCHELEVGERPLVRDIAAQDGVVNHAMASRRQFDRLAVDVAAIDRHVDLLVQFHPCRLQ